MRVGLVGSEMCIRDSKKNNKTGIAALDPTNAQIDLIISVVDTLTSVNVVLSLILFISN